MGYYTSDPATLAEANQGLPPDEHATVVYIPDGAEIIADARAFMRFRELERIRAQARRRAHRGGW